MRSMTAYQRVLCIAIGVLFAWLMPGCSRPASQGETDGGLLPETDVVNDPTVTEMKGHPVTLMYLQTIEDDPDQGRSITVTEEGDQEALYTFIASLKDAKSTSKPMAFPRYTLQIQVDGRLETYHFDAFGLVSGTSLGLGNHLLTQKTGLLYDKLEAIFLAHRGASDEP